MSTVVYKAIDLLALTNWASCFHHQLRRMTQLTIPCCNRSAHQSSLQPLFTSRNSPLQIMCGSCILVSLPLRSLHRTASPYALFLQFIYSTDLCRPFHQVLFDFFHEIQTTYHAVSFVYNPIKSGTYWFSSP